MVEAVARTGRAPPELAKYEISDELGHGGMATVYRARDRRLGREVAVKVIHPHLRDSREMVSRFHAEATAVAKLRHPNIVEVFDVSEVDDPEQYLVVELVRGITLRKLLQTSGAMPAEVAMALALPLLAALGHASSNGVVHRDVKPENVLVEVKPPPASERVVLKLTDFGVAKLLDAQGVTSTGQVLGSPAHMAPEQIEGGEVDARADVFSLGVLVYECMVGHLPFEGTNPAQVLRRVLEGRYPEAQRERPAIGARWSAIVDRALAHAPQDRFTDAGEMRDAILAELDRLGFTGIDRELEAWIDDPEAYEPAHARRMVEKLCALGGQARARGDAIAAAADYNRALSHAPDDAQLLRIVAGMNRARVRARWLRRGLAGVGVAAGVVALTVGVRRIARDHRPSIASVPILVATAPSASPSSSAVADGSIEAEVPHPSAVSSISPLPSRIMAAPIVPREPSQAPRPASDRLLQLDLRPPMGVSVSIDDQPPRKVSTGDALDVDTKGHVLTFTCPVCVPVRMPVAAGDKSDTLSVSVPIKAAIVVVEGDTSKSYQMVQHPELTVRVGPNTVTLRSAFEAVTIQQIETGNAVSVRLEAGKTVRATF